MKILYKAVHKLRVGYWYLTRPNTKGSRALLIRNGKVLLVKHTYQDQLYIPGGKLKRGEGYTSGLRRELYEELGIECHELLYFGAYNNQYEYKNDDVEIYLSEDFSIDTRRNFEIESYGFYDIFDLPKEISPGSRRRIEEYVKRDYPKKGVW